MADLVTVVFTCAKLLILKKLKPRRYNSFHHDYERTFKHNILSGTIYIRDHKATMFTIITLMSV